MNFPIDLKAKGYEDGANFTVRFTVETDGEVIFAEDMSTYKLGDSICNWVDASNTVFWKSVSSSSHKSPEHKSRNIGNSDYAEHTIQPWDIWREYSLNPWDADIVKRVLRTKEGDSRKLDYEKIIHICQERIAQIDGVYE